MTDKTVLTDAEKVRIAAECGVFCTMPQAVAFYDAVLASAGEQAKDAVTLCKQADHAGREYSSKYESEGNIKQAQYWKGYSDGAAVCARAIASGKSGEVGS